MGDRARACIALFDALNRDKLIDDAQVQITLYNLAIGGDVQAICEYNRRRFGNPPTQVDITSDGAELSFFIEPTRPQDRDAWLAAHSESQREMARADMGIDPTEGEPN